MNKQRLFILIAGLIGVASTFLPWVRIEIIGQLAMIMEGVDLSAGRSYAIAFVVIVVFSFLFERKQPIKGLNQLVVFFCGFFVLFAVIRDYFSLLENLKELYNEENLDYMAVFVDKNFSWGLGIYLSAAASAAIVVLAMLSGKFIETSESTITT